MKTGIEAVIEMMQVMEPADRERLLARLALEDPKLVEKVRAEILRFEDLLALEPIALQTLLREVPSARLAVALRGIPDDLASSVYRNLSVRAAQLLRDELIESGPRKRSEVDSARAEVLALARKLEAAGKIQIPSITKK